MTTAAYEINTDALGTSSNSRRFRTWTFTGEQVERYREFGDCVYTDAQERAENLAYNARFTDQQMAERMAVDSHLKVTGWNCTVVVKSAKEMVA
jgi:hypothetical protein